MDVRRPRSDQLIDAVHAHHARERDVHRAFAQYPPWVLLKRVGRASAPEGGRRLPRGLRQQRLTHPTATLRCRQDGPRRAGPRRRTSRRARRRPGGCAAGDREHAEGGLPGGLQRHALPLGVGGSAAVRGELPCAAVSGRAGQRREGRQAGHVAAPPGVPRPAAAADSLRPQ